MDMKYGTFTGIWGYPKREAPVDWGNLPKKCCYKCDNWVECAKREYGACTIACDLEYDRFSYADDCCDNYTYKEE